MSELKLNCIRKPANNCDWNRNESLLGGTNHLRDPLSLVSGRHSRKVSLFFCQFTFLKLK